MNIEQTKPQPRKEKGRFGSGYKEPRGKAIAVRLPESIDKEIRIAAGDSLADFVRSALVKELERVKAQKAV